MEAQEPYYIIGISTGTPAAVNRWNENLTLPCPVNRGEGVDCTPVRLTMMDLLHARVNGTSQGTNDENAMSVTPLDHVLAKAFWDHHDAGYPQDLLSVNHDGDVDEFYVSQSTLYSTQANAGLEWRIIVVSPGDVSTDDTITKDGNSGLFAAVIALASFGVVICSAMVIYFFRNRTETSIQYADWRFTCAFIFGSVLLNGSTYTLLGENTDELCLTRLWTFHGLFAMTLSPLFVKIWRMNLLVGKNAVNFTRVTINHTTAACWTLPLIVAQLLILMIFTLVDPPVSTELIETSGSSMVQRIVCQTETNAFVITQGVFIGLILFTGCVLAYKTRNLDSRFKETKQLIFAIYNVSFVFVIISVVVGVSDDMDDNGAKILQGVGVFWGTVCSSAAFVLPRMLQARKMAKRQSQGTRSSIFLKQEDSLMF